MRKGNQQMTQILELFDKDFKTAIIKNPLISNYEYCGNKWKNRKSWQRNRRYKEEPDGDFRTEHYNNLNLKLT